MLRGRVPLVDGEVVLREGLVQAGHQTIPTDFGNDRRGGNRDRQPIAFDDRALREGDGRQPKSVDEQPIGTSRQCIHGPPHCQPGRLQDVLRVDLLYARGSDSNPQRPTEDFFEQPLAVVLRELFGIREAGEHGSARENHCGCNNRPGQGTAPRLIEAGDPPIPAASDLRFEFVVGLHRKGALQPSPSPNDTQPTVTRCEERS